MKTVRRICSSLLCIICCFSLFTEPVWADSSWPSDVTTDSPNIIVMEMNTGAVLYEKNADEIHYPASITKILTALVAIENSDLDEEVTFSYDSIYNTEGSGIARDVGEVMTMEQCLYGMMLESSNECAYAIAEHVAGDVDSFVDMMNEKAQELGCTNTHFNNSNGLPDEDHYTTCRDMALIATAAYENETFRIIVGTGTYQIPPTNKHDEITYLRNHHNMLYPTSSYDYLYDYCTGGKTGYTEAANSTLVTYAEKDGMKLVVVVMNAESPNHYTDTITLMDYCFENFQLWNISENEDSFSSQKETFFDTDVELFDRTSSMLTIDEDAMIVLPVNVDFSSAEYTVNYSDDQDKVAQVVYTYKGHQVGTADLTLGDLSEISFSMPSDQTTAGSDAQPVVIHLRRILAILGIVILAVAVLMVIRYWHKNFYILKHKRQQRKATASFGTVKKRRERRQIRWPWKKRRW